MSRFTRLFECLGLVPVQHELAPIKPTVPLLRFTTVTIINVAGAAANDDLAFTFARQYLLSKQKTRQQVMYFIRLASHVDICYCMLHCCTKG